MFRTICGYTTNLYGCLLDKKGQKIQYPSIAIREFIVENAEDRELPISDADIKALIFQYHCQKGEIRSLDEIILATEKKLAEAQRPGYHLVNDGKDFAASYIKWLRDYLEELRTDRSKILTKLEKSL